METETKAQLDDILSQYNVDKSQLIPILQKAQERFGYLPEEVLVGIARFLRIAASVVYGVVTFYAQFKLTPTGKKTIKVCRGTACHVRGGAAILNEVEKKLGIKPGETTEDLEYTLETIACFGSCALAPVMVVDDNVYGRMTTKKTEEIVSNAE